jgi:hypothetical protein
MDQLQEFMQVEVVEELKLVQEVMVDQEEVEEGRMDHLIIMLQEQLIQEVEVVEDQLFQDQDKELLEDQV